MSIAGETASSVMRTLEFLVDKHCKTEQETTAPRAPVTLLAAIPRVERKQRKKTPPVTEELHDEIYAEGTTTSLSSYDLAVKYNMSPNNIRLIISRRHRKYHPVRTERYVRRRVEIPA